MGGKDKDDLGDISYRKEMAIFLSLGGASLSVIGFVASAWASPADDEEEADRQPIKELGLWRVCFERQIQDYVRTVCLQTHTIALPGKISLRSKLLLQDKISMGFCTSQNS